MIGVVISHFLVAALMLSSATLCNSQLKLKIWSLGEEWGVGTPATLFEYTDEPVLYSASEKFYLSVQAQPANNPKNPGDEIFCWIGVVADSDAVNKTQVWRAPCDRELQRTDDSMQMCFAGLSAGGSLQLRNANKNITFSSNTSGLGVNHAIVDDLGSVLLQTADNVTVWTSASLTTPPACLQFGLGVGKRPTPASPPVGSNTTAPAQNSARMISREVSGVFAAAIALNLAFEFLH